MLFTDIVRLIHSFVKGNHVAGRMAEGDEQLLKFALEPDFTLWVSHQAEYMLP
jgi:hypothetical protein